MKDCLYNLEAGLGVKDPNRDPIEGGVITSNHIIMKFDQSIPFKIKMLREIILDLETTGLQPGEGHRVVEIGAVELLDKVPSGKTFQCYLNPGRDVPLEAVKVHGLTKEFLQKYPTFSDKVKDLSEFIGRAPIVAHNAPFDVSFLNHELKLINQPPVKSKRVVDTLSLARQKYPGQRCTLDILLIRLGIQEVRGTHGALLDAQLLARVYPKLCKADKVFT